MDRTALGAQVRARRIELGLTLREAAARTGVDYTHISNIERGARNVTVDTYNKIMSGLGGDAVADPNAALVSRFAALLPRLSEAQRATLLHLIAMFEQAQD
jgi:transcriptional regulator with XRE-family HTH domain